MSVYTDGTHLMADTLTELHAFARRIGLKREWFQDHRHPHYDLFGVMAQRAVDAGAKPMSTKTMLTLQIMNRYSEAVDREVFKECRPRLTENGFIV